VAEPGTTVTSSGTESVKGTPAELMASTSFDAYRVLIVGSGDGVSATASAGALDILTGASTEEGAHPQPALRAGRLPRPGIGGPKVWEFRLYVPAGSRISAQAAGERLTIGVKVWIYHYGGMGMPMGPCGSKVTTYGMGTVPNGTALTPGASGAEGGWPQITASTTEDHFHVTITSPGCDLR
jgi:hypothetical protein